MKGEFTDPKPEPSPSSTGMFTNLHHLSTSPASATSSHPSKPSGADGATIEVGRRPRGRPPGSKNKPKPPVFLTREPQPPMSPYIFEVPSGNDVVDALQTFCRHKNVSICVLSGSGAVSNVTLRQPSPAAPGSTITFHGKFEILSISATFLTALSPPLQNVLSLSLAAPQGQIVGGFVTGPLMAVGTVFVVASTFNNPTYHRLPVDEEARNSVSSGTRGGDRQSPPVSGDGGHVSGGESCGLGMYSSDVIWAPTARPPPYC